MTGKTSRRKLLGGAAAAGLAASISPRLSAQTAAKPKSTAKQGLPNVWGEDFLYQWSPPDVVPRDLKPGSSPIRLSHVQMTSNEGTDYNQLFKSMRDGGWTACEVGSAQWLRRKVTDSEKREIKTQLAAHDIKFYGIHCAGNIIAPDPENVMWQRHIIEAYESAEEMGCDLILTHVGSHYSSRDIAHPLNWSKQGWTRSVNALKNIAKATAGGKTWIAIEPVNSEAINNPWAQVRLKEDVGDARIMSGLDITNMVYPGVAFRMTEFMHLTFDMLEDQIAYVHAKDFAWDGMMAGLNWAMNGTGNMDYETFLVRISRIKHPVNMLVEFLPNEEEYKKAQRSIRSIAAKVGVKIEGTQPA